MQIKASFIVDTFAFVTKDYGTPTGCCRLVFKKQKNSPILMEGLHFTKYVMYFLLVQSFCMFSVHVLIQIFTSVLVADADIRIIKCIHRDNEQKCSRAANIYEDSLSVWKVRRTSQRTTSDRKNKFPDKIFKK